MHLFIHARPRIDSLCHITLLPSYAISLYFQDVLFQMARANSSFLPSQEEDINKSTELLAPKLRVLGLASYTRFFSSGNVKAPILVR